MQKFSIQNSFMNFINILCLKNSSIFYLKIFLYFVYVFVQLDGLDKK